MPEPRTTPKEHDKPVFQPGSPAPGTPTPEDPRENEPIQDPPVEPEHDDAPRLADGNNDVERGVGTARSTDSIVFDENQKPG